MDRGTTPTLKRVQIRCCDGTESQNSSLVLCRHHLNSATCQRADREVTLERLEVQLDYLMKEMEEIRAEEDSIFSEWLRGDRTPAPPRGSPKGQRRRLLNELYLQRLLSFEVLRMEVETELRQGS